ncbi:hypothetical protein CHRY9293_00165 [Chryseobacterium potabilaquae]|uniref:Uncharacterized protein n=1 Tax=Chryseobacterium potabilaquae TaxID=2675057 RepID=A0A6N4X1R5_9FLAO|nr:hypothetical protein CHRY9293_00165 [Chryseobacterium potabilaquae]
MKENHFLSFFVYDIITTRAMSNTISIIEIIIVKLLEFSVKFAFS